MSEVQLQHYLDQAYGFGEVHVSVTPTSVDVWNGDGEWRLLGTAHLNGSVVDV